MLERVRRFFHDSDVTVGVVTGVVGGFALIRFLRSLVFEFVMPVLVNAIGRTTVPGDAFLVNAEVRDSIGFDWGAITFDFTSTIADAITFAIVVAVIYAVFVWVRAPSEQQDLRTRECPECKSEIWADARRCRFCTSAVEPVEVAAAARPARPTTASGGD